MPREFFDSDALGSSVLPARAVLQLLLLSYRLCNAAAWVTAAAAADVVAAV
jgi:hypothetical protein